MYNTDKKSMLAQDLKVLKKKTLRYNEYYHMQPIFDNLYQQSKNNSKFTHLYNLIVKDENILLAYRTIKRNHGSKTAETNRKTILHLENQTTGKFIQYIKNRLKNFQPLKIRRVEIPKPNGKTRPLGIPCIEDRIIQQCIKQVLEPICEAKFHHNSYGFRPNRSTENAIAYVYKKINLDKNYFMVDVDIKGFFDHVNHSKLLKQIWGMGIQDKKVISIISAMLKAEIEGIRTPTEGVPQGGIISPLLSNIVLNELDWWISNQWETFTTNHQFSVNYAKYSHLRKKSKLKEMYIVRYADDFKIMCKELSSAKAIYHAVQQWLKERLNLEISQEKSKITDVRKEATEFLGIKIKAYRKYGKWIVRSSMTDKAKEHAQTTIKNQILYIQNHPNPNTVYMLNRIISGLHNYYRIATEINRNFSRIQYNLSVCLKKRLSRLRTKKGTETEEYQNKYGHFGGKKTYVMGNIVYPINGIRRKPMLCNYKATQYSKEGRETIHSKLGFIDKEIIKYLSSNPIRSRSIELNDNRLSLYAAQKGKCPILGIKLDESLVVHHITPIEFGGADYYKNLVLLTPLAHLLIHAVGLISTKMYLIVSKLSPKALKKLNDFRIKVGNEIIVSE